MIHVKIHVVSHVVGLPRAFRIISSHLCPFGVFRDSGMTSPPPPQSVTVKLKDKIITCCEFNEEPTYD